MVRRALAAAALVMFALGTVGLAKTKFTSTWKAPGFASSKFGGKKVAALIMSEDESLRMSAEEALAREITARGMQGVAAYRLVPREETRDPAKARGWFEQAGVDGVVTMRIVSAETRRTYTPSYWTAPSYGTLWSYYGYGWGSLYIPGSVREDFVLAVETLIYSVPQDALLWAGVSETTNPKEVGKVVNELVKQAAKEIKK